MTMMLLSRRELLAELAKRLPETISASDMEGGIDVSLEGHGIQIRLTSESSTSSLAKVTKVELHSSEDESCSTEPYNVQFCLPAEPEADMGNRALERSSSSTICDEPDSVNSLTGELHYRELFQKVHMAAALHEVIVENGTVVDTRFKDVNPAFCTLFELDRDEVVGHRLTRVFPGIEKDKVDWIRNFGCAGVEGKRFDFNTYSQRLDGWFAGVAYRPDPSRTDFCVIFEDVSKDVETEESLAESEERHRNLFECMVQGVVYQDEDGHIIMANAAAERILGLTVDQMKGRQSIDPRWKAIHVDGSDFPGDTHPAMVALKTGEKQMNVTMGVYHPGEDRHHWIKVDAIPRFHKNCTTPFQVYTTFTDITDEKKASEALFEAKVKAQHADSLKSAFLATMSHEMRTPLNGIMGYIELALSNGLALENREENMEGLRIAKSSGELLLSIISDILDLSKIEAGEMEIKNTEAFSLKEMVDTTTSLARSLVTSSKKNIHVATEISPDLSDCINGDPYRVQQILSNLLSNSVKFTTEGEIHLNVAKGKDDSVQMQISDTGKGIDGKLLEAIFEPFRQIEIGDTRTYGGTGLGLTISRKLARMMSGDLVVESTIDGSDHGSCFTLTFPYKPSDADKIQRDSRYVWNHTQNHDKQRQSGDDNSQKNILVVEDDPVSRRLMNRMLTKMGYKVLLACNGLEGVNIYQENGDVGLILMDIQMPIMDGHEATKLIREIERKNPLCSVPVPIVALSACVMKGDQERGLANGMTDYLSKPVNLKLLTCTLEKCVGTPTRK